MTAINYANGESRLMTYNPKTQKVTSVTDQEGKITEYEYLVFYNDDGSKNSDHYGTKISNYDNTGNRYTNTYEYIVGTRVNGQRFNQMVKKEVNGVKTETHYDELCGNPLSIEREDLKTTFKYNNRCLLIEKHSATGESFYLEYHPDFEKITKVTRNGITSVFDYNENGLLTYAEDNSNKWMKLKYGNEGNIINMTMKKSELSFKYNEINKPSVILIKGKGTVYYTYDDKGDFLNVETDGEDSLPMEVNKAYQTLMELVKPAGVNLKME